MSFKSPDIEKIYSEDKNLTRDDIDSISKWLKTQPHLPDLTELQIILFLHSCYYRIDSIKKTIDNYFTLRTQHPYIFDCATVDAIRHFSSVEFCTVLPKITPEGYIVLVMKLLDPKPRNFICVETVKVAVMIATLHVHQNGPSSGLLLLIDMKDSGLGHLFRMNIMVIKRILNFFQEAAPVRIQGIHLLNPVSVTQKLMTVMKPFMKEDLFKMIKFHSGSMESLYLHVPKNCLPKDFGGEDSSIQLLQEQTIQNLLNNLDFFKWHDSQKVEESRRHVVK